MKKLKKKYLEVFKDYYNNNKEVINKKIENIRIKTKNGE